MSTVKSCLYPSCPVCDATDTVYRGTRGDEEEGAVDVAELQDNEPCVCYEHIEQCTWRQTPGLPTVTAPAPALDSIEDDKYPHGIVLREDMAGAPFKIGDVVRIGIAQDDETFSEEHIGKIARVIAFNKDCGASFPEDPFIVVAGYFEAEGVEVGKGEHWQDSFWKEELKPVKLSNAEIASLEARTDRAACILEDAARALRQGKIGLGYRLTDKAHDHICYALETVGVDSDACIYQEQEHDIPAF